MSVVLWAGLGTPAEGGGPFRVPGMAIGPGGVPTVTVAGCCDCFGGSGSGNGATYAECEISCDTTTFTRWPVTWCTNSFIGMTGSGPATGCPPVAEAIAMTDISNAPPYTPPCLAPVWNRGPVTCPVDSVQHSMQFNGSLARLELLVFVSDGVTGVATAVYAIACADLNMEVSNVMDLITVGGYDIANYNFPASITITPCPTP